ncbi:hypothetical protein PAMP_006407 [Pampus punctatissimus]
MACLKLAVFVPVKVMSLTILMSVIFLSSVKTGVCMKPTATCWAVCSGTDCITVNQDRLDFKKAEETCRNRNGELVTFQTHTDETILYNLSQELYGNFWIGLRLPANACSNLSAPLRGYEWTSVGMHGNDIPLFNTWKDNVKVCSSYCVSLSNNQMLTERLCSDKTDGFLCRTNHKDACQATELSDPNFFRSSKGCSDGPCEHICTDVNGGYICSCFKGYIPDSKDPKQCKMHCAEQKCPVICDTNTDNICFCPEGFIRNEKFCEDIDECSMQECQQQCKNTFGGFSCSCKEGFILKGQVNCIRADNSEHFVVTTPIVIDLVKPTLKISSVSASSFIWLWICIAVAVAVLICIVRFYVVKLQKRREQNSNQRSAAPVDNNEC